MHARLFHYLTDALSVVYGEVWTLHGYERPVLLLDSYTICLVLDIHTHIIFSAAYKYS